MIRSQTVLVVAVIGLVIWLASDLAGSGDAPATPEVSPVPTTIVSTVEPTTPPPVAVAPTAEPTATTAPTEEPTPAPTDEPASTERPAPPETNQDSSLIVEYGTSGRREVALTFDAGEGAGHTEEILDLLAESNLVASFGVTGQWAEQNPELLQRIVAEGHQVINHTYDHRSYTGTSTQGEPLTEDEFRDQVTRTEAIIEEITGGYVSKPYFRFPYGDYDQTALELLGDLGYSYTMWWSCDTMGWYGYTPGEIVENCGPQNEKEGGAGAIILMHVADDNDWEALEPLIEVYAADGYAFVTLEQMIQP